MATAKNIHTFEYVTLTHHDADHCFPSALAVDEGTLSGLVYLSPADHALLITLGSTDVQQEQPAMVVPDNDGAPTSLGWDESTILMVESAGRQMVADGEAMLEQAREARSRLASGEN